MSRQAELRAVVDLPTHADSKVQPPVERGHRPGEFLVLSRRGGQRYTVNLTRSSPSCSCPWFDDRRNESGTCKHVEAARLAIAANRGLGVAL